MEDDKFIPWFEDMEEVKSRRLVLQELRKGNQNLARNKSSTFVFFFLFRHTSRLLSKVNDKFLFF